VHRQHNAQERIQQLQLAGAKPGANVGAEDTSGALRASLEQCIHTLQLIGDQSAEQAAYDDTTVTGTGEKRPYSRSEDEASGGLSAGAAKEPSEEKISV